MTPRCHSCQRPPIGMSAVTGSERTDPTCDRAFGRVPACGCAELMSGLPGKVGAAFAAHALVVFSFHVWRRGCPGSGALCVECTRCSRRWFLAGSRAWPDTVEPRPAPDTAGHRRRAPTERFRWSGPFFRLVPPTGFEPALPP